MKIPTQYVSVDITPGGVTSTIHASQYDNGRQASIKIVKGYSPITTDKTMSARIEGTKRDGTGFQYPCELDGDVATFTITEQMTMYPGNTTCEIVLFKNDTKIATANFILKVEKAPLGKDVKVSDSDLPLIIEAGKNIKEAKAAAESATKSEKNAKASADAAAGSASAAATSEKNTKASEQAAAGSAAKAADSEKNTKASENAAATSESNAKDSESAAATSEKNAKASENASKASENAAKASQDAAKTSENNAKASEDAAAKSAAAAKASEDNAKVSETAAAES